jgi:hypothetical protein
MERTCPPAHVARPAGENAQRADMCVSGQSETRVPALLPAFARGTSPTAPATLWAPCAPSMRRAEGLARPRWTMTHGRRSGRPVEPTMLGVRGRLHGAHRRALPIGSGRLAAAGRTGGNGEMRRAALDREPAISRYGARIEIAADTLRTSSPSPRRATRNAGTRRARRRRHGQRLEEDILQHTFTVREPQRVRTRFPTQPPRPRLIWSPTARKLAEGVGLSRRGRCAEDRR